MTRFAEGTKVSISQSQGELERLLKRYGATGFGYASEDDRTVVAFKASGRRVRFSVPPPDPKRFREQDQREREMRRLWRALLLSIKSKLEVVASGIAVFDEEFLAHIVIPETNTTIGEQALPAIKIGYDGGKMPPLLPYHPTQSE